MKFTKATTLLLVLLPAVSSVAAQRNRGNQGNNNNNQGNNNQGNNNANQGNNNANQGNNNANQGNNNANQGNNNANQGNNNNNGGNVQDSLTLDPSVICTGCQQDGQDPPVAGQEASLTSNNNFIEFCRGKTFTNGEQNAAGSCNAVPMGQIIPTTSMPSSKISNPPNGGTFPANQPLTFTMNTQNMNLGNFVNAQKNYFGAPQQVQNGIVTAHSHVTVQLIPALDSTEIPDPKTFAFFKGLNDKDQNGVLSTELAAGLPAGVYRFCSMNTAANHQPVNVAVAQHGSLDDCIYATAVDGNAGNNNNNGGNNNNNNAGNNNNNAGNNNADAGNNNANAGNNNNNAGNNNADPANNNANPANNDNAANNNANGGNNNANGGNNNANGGDNNANGGNNNANGGNNNNVNTATDTAIDTAIDTATDTATTAATTSAAATNTANANQGGNQGKGNNNKGKGRGNGRGKGKGKGKGKGRGRNGRGRFSRQR